MGAASAPTLVTEAVLRQKGSRLLLAPVRPSRSCNAFANSPLVPDPSSSFSRQICWESSWASPPRGPCDRGSLTTFPCSLRLSAHLSEHACSRSSSKTGSSTDFVVNPGPIPPSGTAPTSTSQAGRPVSAEQCASSPVSCAGPTPPTSPSTRTSVRTSSPRSRVRSTRSGSSWSRPAQASGSRCQVLS